jgi:DNA-binding transcriptional ArsR family regulator
MIETFAALAEPNRFRIVELLLSGARSVNEIGERLALNQPQVSKHLRVLKEVGLVEMEPRAQQRVYELRGQPLRALNDWLDRYRRLWDVRFEALDELLEEIEPRQTSKQQARQATKERTNDRKADGKKRR